MEERGYPTPEEAALAGFAPVSRAWVRRVEIRGAEAIVWVDMVPSHPMEVVCERRTDGLWYFSADMG